MNNKMIKYELRIFANYIPDFGLKGQNMSIFCFGVVIENLESLGIESNDCKQG